MPVHFVYMLKASVCLAVIYLFYITLLKRITYYTWNRFFLLIYSILSCIIPFMNASVFLESKQLNNIAFLNHVPSLPTFAGKENSSSAFPGFIINMLSVVFIIGFFVMLIRLFIQLLSLWRLHLKAALLQDGRVKIYHVSEPIVPFSFFNNIYLNKDNYCKDDLSEIVNHELVHVQQKHTIDIVIAQIICMLNWYNPFVWLVRKAIKDNLEFIADDAVIMRGINKKNYQYLLLKVTGNVSFSIANNLNFSSLKSRIHMMNRTRTNKLHLLKFALLVPMATMLLLAFRNKQQVYTNKYKEQTKISKTYILSSLTYSITNKKIEVLVKNDEDRCLLKTGEALNLELVYNERIRLKDLLEKSGFDNLGDHPIVFMIDTTLGNNNFSIQVNINLAKDRVIKSNDGTTIDTKITAPVNNIQTPVSATKSVIQPQNISASDNLVEDQFNSQHSRYDNKVSANK